MTPSKNVGQGTAPINVVLVTGSLLAGGAERVLSGMANYWADRGLQVTLATWSGPECPDFYAIAPAVNRVWLDVESPNNSQVMKFHSNFLRIRKLRKLLVDSSPDAVLSFIDKSNILTILTCIGLHIRVVVSERTNPAMYAGLSWPWRILRRWSYPVADAVVAQTGEVAQWLEENCAARTCTIPNPLRDLPIVSNTRENRILTVGRLDRVKGVDLLLRAFARIYRDFQDWRVTVVGTGPEGVVLRELRDELGLRRLVEFIEPLIDVEQLMSRSGLVVQPSRYEGFPNVVLEAMGMGAAVVCANCSSGPAEIIEDGVNGRLVPVENVPALASVMAELMADSEMRERLGNKAKEVRQRYRQDRIMGQWEACLSGPVHRNNSAISDGKEVSVERRQ